jgi:Transglycosylase SLT domain
MNMLMRARWFVTMLLFTSFPLVWAKTADTPDAQTAWKNYALTETDIRPSYQFPYASCFRASALAYQVPESLLLAVARGESDFEKTARSKSNAHGVMQIQWPGTAQHLGIYRLSELYEPCTNIDAGARYLKELMARYNGNIHLTLAAYNYGPGRISIDGSDIPEGAQWYSGYIYRHLTYVLGDRSERGDQNPPGSTLYSDLGQTTLLSFGEPYRAAAFVAGLEARAPQLQLDWFRKGVGKFVVVLTYGDKDEFHASAAQLANAGFPLD